ncbi:hypothetical protein [Ekhidna sp.]|uniref:hypothetical protein n=1 Tax=Ekhidna sp. TaxID=2608089 RepID=UPI0032996C48
MDDLDKCNECGDKDILLAELNNCYDSINVFITNQSKIINFSSAVFGALIALSFSGIADETSKVFLVLPYLLLTINSYLAYNLIRSYVIHGYRRYLEFQLNKMSRRHLIFYSRLVKDHLLSGNIIAILPIIINLLIMIFALIECYRVASNVIQQVSFVWIPSFMALLIVILTFIKIKVYKKTYSASLEYSKLQKLEDY